MTMLAERMMEAMIDFGINQTELAEKTGITKGALSSYLSGRYEPKRDNLQKIAKALDVDEGWLMGDDAVDSFDFEQKVIDSLNRIEETLLRIERLMGANEQKSKEVACKDLTKKRAKAQMKQKELARLMGVSVNEIKAWESQEKIPSAEQAEMLDIIFRGW